MKRTLLLGYGNVDRQDDGVAWHVLAGVAQRLGLTDLPPPEDGFELEAGALPGGEPIDFLFVLQLTPELAENVSQYERVCFIDAHTGAVPGEVNVVSVDSAFQTSPFTHHMTASTLIAMCETLYGVRPEAVLVSIRGYEFGFSHGLSANTETASREAVERILVWISEESNEHSPDD